MLNRSNSSDLPLDLSLNKLNQNKSNIFKPYIDCNSRYKIKSNKVKSTLLSNQISMKSFIDFSNTTPFNYKLSSSFYISDNQTSTLDYLSSYSDYSSSYQSLINQLNNNSFLNNTQSVNERSSSYSPNSTLSSNSNASSSFFSSNSIDFNYKPIKEMDQNKPIDLSNSTNQVETKANQLIKLDQIKTIKPKIRKPKQQLKLIENNDNQILIKCPSCWQLFDQENSLRKHIKSKHQINECSTSFDRIHKCEHCVLAFTRFDMLQRHNRKHTGDKPYECNLCFRNFSRSDHLNTHRINHFGLKPYICNLCPYASSRRDMVSRHLQTHSKSAGAYVKTDLIAKQICRKLVHTHPDQIPGLLNRFKAEC